MARRLVENGTNSVALIEAGGLYEIENGSVSQIPAYVAYNSSFSGMDIQPLIDWVIVTEPPPVSHLSLL